MIERIVDRRFSLLVAFWSCVSASIAVSQDDVALVRDVVYVKRGERELHLDLAMPAGDEQLRPLVLYIHGGGWSAGQRGSFHDRVRHDAKRGYVAATVEYRFAPKHRWPACWEDVKTALAFLRERASEYRIDPRRVAVCGASAGGHLALMTALAADDAPPADRVQCAINLFGPVDLERDQFRPQIATIVDGLLGEEGDAAPASPLQFVSAGDPPVLTLHGIEDNVVPVKHAELLDAALAKAGVPHETRLFEQQWHGFDENAEEEVEWRMDEFLDRYLRGSTMPLIVHEDFDEGMEGWTTTDPKSWEIGGTESDPTLALISKTADYKTPVRSPVLRAMADDVEVGDFVFDVRVKTTHADYGHRDLCLFFGYQDPSHFYYVHLGQEADPHAHSIFLVDGAPRRSIAAERTDGTPWDELWHRVRIRRSVEKGTIEVFFDDFTTPVMQAQDTTFGAGQIGVGSFDDTGEFDVIRVRGTPGED